MVTKAQNPVSARGYGISPSQGYNAIASAQGYGISLSWGYSAIASARGYNHPTFSGVRGVRHLTFSGVQRDHVSLGVQHLTFSGVRGVRHLTFSGVQRDHVSSGVRHFTFSGVRPLTFTADDSSITSARGYRGYKSHLLGADESTLLTPWHLTKWRSPSRGPSAPHEVSAAPHDVRQ